MEKVTLSNMELVKEWLKTIGWKPDDWNVKKGHNGQWIRTGPKLTSTSLAKLQMVLLELQLMTTIYLIFIYLYLTIKELQMK